MFNKNSRKTNKSESKQLEKLVKRAVKGDKNAFEELVNLNTEGIVFTAYNVVGNYHDAEDVAQEVILKMHKEIRNLRSPGAFKAWLQRITINQSYQMTRKAVNKRETIGTDEMFTEIMEDDREFLPQEFAENKELQKQVREVVNKLSYEKRMVVTMYYYHDMSYKEIAYALELPIGTVSSEITRARTKIRKELEASGVVKNWNINKTATTPVMSVILSQQAKEEIPRSVIENVVSYTQTKVLGGAAAKAGATGIFTVKSVSIALLCTAVVASGTVFGISTVQKNKATDVKNKNEITQQDSQDQSKNAIDESDMTADIEFMGDEKNNQVNPKTIAVTDLAEDYENVTWVITNEDNTKKYNGEGIAISDKLTSLYENKEDGNYNVVFTVTYPHGELLVDTDFVIDTE